MGADSLDRLRATIAGALACLPLVACGVNARPDPKLERQRMLTLIRSASRHGTPSANCAYVFDGPRAVARCREPDGDERVFVARREGGVLGLLSIRPDALRACDVAAFGFSKAAVKRLREAGIAVRPGPREACAIAGGLAPGDVGDAAAIAALRRLPLEGDALPAVRVSGRYALTQEQFEDGFDLMLYEHDDARAGRLSGWRKIARLPVADGPPDRVDAEILQKRYRVPASDARAIAPPRLSGRDGR